MTKRKPPTKKQQEVYLYIVEHIERKGFQPTQQEMADAFGVDKKAINQHLKQLEKLGYITLPGPNKERCISLRSVGFTRRFTGRRERENGGGRRDTEEEEFEGDSEGGCEMGCEMEADGDGDGRHDGDGKMDGFSDKPTRNMDDRIH